ncbi:hypothetical protein ACFP9V_18425 [Deinococcus radiopugnans]|uniref:Uncharacterized protein n=1 Tax=Deinococcus radiopugnans ATCC 19172 TaxID=585398 RepID=A0A5C4Y7W2_9DEIO|nr:hypothetical protein [Deinococcus radiopugnans]MBB6017466.1 hypothetical protein [Deinococcus radiopugnans ATCC 19172]TNM71992.1 hypothetical protein FHR04_06415 [Deinococcus radiopugnans ATCC 19172]
MAPVTPELCEGLIRRLADAIVATILLDRNDATQVYFVTRNLACRRVSEGDYRSRILIRKYNFMVEQARNFNIDALPEAAQELINQNNASDRFTGCWKTITQNVGVVSQNLERAIQIVVEDNLRWKALLRGTACVPWSAPRRGGRAFCAAPTGSGSAVEFALPRAGGWRSRAAPPAASG